jgi:acetylornithine aminotransferase
VAATDNPKIIAPINQTDHVVFLPFNDEAALEACFLKEGERIAAVIVEGIQGVGGINVATDSFLQKIRAQCDAYGAVYIADSVQCGYGRSGKFFAHDWAGVPADIYTTAKGMGNGFPVAGVWIAPHLKPWHGMLGTTFGGNPLACAAALAVAETIETENLLENARTLGDYLTNMLRDLPVTVDVRGRGLMIGIDLPPEKTDLRQRLLYEKGVFTGEAKPNVVRLLPSLALTRAEADFFLQAFSSL